MQLENGKFVIERDATHGSMQGVARFLIFPLEEIVARSDVRRVNPRGFTMSNEKNKIDAR